MKQSVLEIEKNIEKLSYEEFTELNKWYVEFENKIWDEKIMINSNNINLLNLAENAIFDFQNGNTKQL